MFIHAINSARQRLWIASPYFVPDEGVIAALQLAALRGVDVRILIPDMPDHLAVYLAAYSYFDEVEQTGVRFYRYTDGFLHEKAMLIDDKAATIGTANFDNRSFRLNFDRLEFWPRPRVASLVASTVPQELQDKSALIVENNATTRLVLSRYIKSFGFSTETTDTAEKAIEIVKRAAANEPLKLVVMDVSLPGLDGLVLGSFGEAHGLQHLVDYIVDWFQRLPVFHRIGRIPGFQLSDHALHHVSELFGLLCRKVP